MTIEKMTFEIEQQLKQGGQAIKQQADSRLEHWDVSASVMQAIADDNSSHVAAITWWYGLAAAIGLTVMVWTISSTDSIQQKQPSQNQQITTKAVVLKLNQLPLSLEQKINQPLLDEQQAIMADLKALREQLLSI